MVFAALALGHHRAARVLAALAIVPGLVALLQAQLTGIMPAPFGSWAFWILFNLVPVAAMTAFHRDAPRAAAGRLGVVLIATDAKNVSREPCCFGASRNNAVKPRFQCVLAR